MTELKPCPFCGCNYLEVECSEYYAQYWVSCPKCEITSKSYNTREKAICGWNKRVKG